MSLELNKIYNMDCLEGMKLLEDNSVDLVLTDPPYGISRNKLNMGKGGGVSDNIDYGEYEWDNETPSQAVFNELFRISKNQIIFGGNYFDLPPSPCWLVWDKKTEGTDFADCELAWTSFTSAVTKFEFRWRGMLQERMKRKEVRFHPTQKPSELFTRILTKYSKRGELVVDPFIGSGTTAISCKRLGIDYIGFELNNTYCEIADNRLRQQVIA